MSWNTVHEIAFGVLSISKSELLKMTPRELNAAYRGYELRTNREKDNFRAVCAYLAAPYSKNAITFDEIVMPGDKPKQKERVLSKTRKLSRENLEKAYKQSGFIIDELELDRIYGT